MFRLAIRSAGPSTSACTRGAAAMASTLVSPRAFFDLRVDADLPDRKAVVRLQLGQQQVQRLDVRDVGHLGQHHHIELGVGRFADSDTTSMMSA